MFVFEDRIVCVLRTPPMGVRGARISVCPLQCKMSEGSNGGRRNTEVT